jgi:hypothetical protein
VIEARFEVAVARINLKERNHLGNLGLDGRIILRWIFRKWNVGVWTGSRWLRIGTGGGHF